MIVFVLLSIYAFLNWQTFLKNCCNTFIIFDFNLFWQNLSAYNEYIIKHCQKVVLFVQSFFWTYMLIIDDSNIRLDWIKYITTHSLFIELYQFAVGLLQSSLRFTTTSNTCSCGNENVISTYCMKQVIGRMVTPETNEMRLPLWVILILRKIEFAYLPIQIKPICLLMMFIFFHSCSTVLFHKSDID